MDFAQRAAAHALAPTLQQIQEDNATLRQRLAIEAGVTSMLGLSGQCLTSGKWTAIPAGYNGCQVLMH